MSFGTMELSVISITDSTSQKGETNMCKQNNDEKTNVGKDFRLSVGFYFFEPYGKYVLAWHNCTNKPMNFSCTQFFHLHAYYSDCPNCGQPLFQWLEMDSVFNNDGVTHLNFSVVSLVRIRKHSHTINVGLFTSDYNLWQGASVFTKSTYYNRFSINIKTGYTYKFEEVTLSKKNDFNKNRRWANVSYTGTTKFDKSTIPSEAIRFLSAIIMDEMKMIHGEDVPSFASYNRNLCFNNLIFYVRNPYICPVIYNSIIETSRRAPCEPIRIKEVLVKNVCREPLQQMLAQSRIPNVKSLKRLVFTKARGFTLLASIARTFKNVDIIRSLYLAYIDCRLEGHSNSYHVDFSAKIFKTMIKFKNESIISAKLLYLIKNDRDNNTYTMLNNMVLDYDRLKNCDFDFTKKYSIDELCYYLTAMVAAQNIQNRIIKYEKDEVLLEESDDTFSIMPAKSTYELISVGMTMDTCLGEYADNVFFGECIVLVMRRIETNAPVGCIELRDGAVVQVKGVNNQLLQNRERRFVEKWVKSRELPVRTEDLKIYAGSSFSS